MNILFVNSNLYGHINPTLGLVKKLTERGHQVSYYCSEPFSEQVIKTCATWIGFSHKLDTFLKEYRPTDRHPFFMLMEYILLYDEVMLPEIVEVVNEGQYDMLICDSIFGGACFLKQITTIPVACSHSSFAMSKAPVPEQMLVEGFHPQLDHCYQILHRICKNYDILEPSLEEVFTSKGDLNIVYTIKEFNGDAKVKEPDYIFNGPSIDRLQESNSLDYSVIVDKKLIYISLGSLNTDFLDFYKTCILAFGNTEYYVCMSIGRKCDVSSLGDIPPNFLVQNYLPQLELLERADTFITHAGFNSVNEALYFGVPMLALPLVNDQYMVAKRLVSMGLGMTESMKALTPELLKSITETLMRDKKIKENCMDISLKIRNSAMSHKTVLKLEEFANVRKERN